ncbi:MAG: hypothetical protein D6750_11005 [Bacteroidetes bacterium]|nr:MAG: hypothetical protein D6750_11005 [Bacteroidota bacterium]
MDAAALQQAWKAFRETLAAYQERLQTEIAEAAQEKDITRLTQLNAAWRQLRRLETALRKVENLLPPVSL